MKQTLTCKRPDRDFPKLTCGYPLPCPYHTVSINLENHDTTIDIPVEVDGNYGVLTLPVKDDLPVGRLCDIARALRKKK